MAEHAVISSDRIVPFEFYEGPVLGHGAESSLPDYAQMRGVVSSESVFPAVVITAPRPGFGADNPAYLVRGIDPYDSPDQFKTFGAPVVPMSVSPWSQILVQIERNGTFVGEYFELQAPNIPTSGARIGC